VSSYKCYRWKCARTQKKQKVFFWEAVDHEKLFLDAWVRECRRQEVEPVVKGDETVKSLIEVKEGGGGEEENEGYVMDPFKEVEEIVWQSTEPLMMTSVEWEIPTDAPGIQLAEMEAKRLLQLPPLSLVSKEGVLTSPPPPQSSSLSRMGSPKMNKSMGIKLKNRWIHLVPPSVSSHSATAVSTPQVLRPICDGMDNNHIMEVVVKKEEKEKDGVPTMVYSEVASERNTTSPELSPLPRLTFTTTAFTTDVLLPPLLRPSVVEVNCSNSLTPSDCLLDLEIFPTANSHTLAWSSSTSSSGMDATVTSCTSWLSDTREAVISEVYKSEWWLDASTSSFTDFPCKNPTRRPSAANNVFLTPPVETLLTGCYMGEGGNSGRGAGGEAVKLPMACQTSVIQTAANRRNRVCYATTRGRERRISGGGYHLFHPYHVQGLSG